MDGGAPGDADAGQAWELRGLLARQRDSFMAAPFPTAASRKAKLRALEAMLKANQGRIAEAISADFGNRSIPETIFSEILTTLAASAHARRHLARWMRPERRAVGMVFQPASNVVEYRPIGVVGIVSPWNYPVFLTLGPLVDILAAGDRCMIKPSELTPATATLLRELLAGIFPSEEVAIVQGDATIARAFCALPFDHLLFTGSTGIGREVMRAAAENLVPVTLELGGKSPVILAGDYDCARAAKLVAVGKFFNAGQTCVSPDYALVPCNAAEAFAESVLAQAEAMYPALSGNPDYTSIISDRHYARLAALVSEAAAAGARVLRHKERPHGNTRHFPPVVVLDPPLDGPLMQEEIFGPILPVVRTESVDEAIAFVNARPRPLALYAFTADRGVRRKILDRTLSGGVTLNGTMLHVSQADMPFGGIGPSGMGAYHGREGFLRFSHARAIHKPGFMSGFEIFRPPHGRRTRLALKALTGFDLR